MSTTPEQMATSMTVLLATDGSDCAGVAVDLVRSIGWPQGSLICVATVVEHAALADVSAEAGREAAESSAPGLDAARAALDRAARSLDETGVRVETAVLTGRPASAIVEKAAAIHADLVVVGSRGHGTIGSMVLGSVSAEVADHAHCPVLVARRHWWRRALLAVDGSPFALLAEQIVSHWPIFAALPIETASVANTAMSWTSGLALSGYAGSIDYPMTAKEIVSEHEDVAADSAERLNAAGLTAHGEVLRGDPATELLRRATDTSADVIVMGTHGRTGVRRLVAGSVARNVMLHASCSVLVVREARPLP